MRTTSPVLQWGNIMDVLDILEVTEERDDEPPRKYLKDLQDPFQKYGEREFSGRFRFTKDCTMKIYDIIKNNPKLQVRAHALNPVLQLLCALRFFATGHFQTTGGDLIGVSRHTARRSVHIISRCIAECKSEFIHPIQDSNEVKRSFFEISGFPKVIGCIGCTHIPIMSPGGDDAEVFRSKKGDFTINCQMICDADRMITNIVARWPGSTHDSRIFQNSVVRDKFEKGKYNGVLLGGKGYALKSYLMIPIANPHSAKEKRYNDSHTKTHSRIEQCFEILKQRFRMLQIPLRMKVENILPAIVAVACLHNFALKTGQVLEDLEDYESHQAEVSTATPPLLSGQDVRQNIIENFF